MIPKILGEFVLQAVVLISRDARSSLSLTLYGKFIRNKGINSALVALHEKWKKSSLFVISTMPS